MGKTNKVVIAGIKGIGKTTLLEQLIYGHFDAQDIHPTIEDIYVANVETDRGTRETLRFYDTEGIGYPPDNSAEIALSKQYHLIADGFVLLYATNNTQSFEVVDALRKDIEKNREKKEVPIVVLGITGRTEDKRKVDPSFVAGWASREKVRHYEVTIKNRKSLLPPFIYLASKLNPIPQKSSFPQFPMGGKKSIKE